MRAIYASESLLAAGTRNQSTKINVRDDAKLVAGWMVGYIAREVKCKLLHYLKRQRLIRGRLQVWSALFNCVVPRACSLLYM
jgi:hypothetical protein